MPCLDVILTPFFFLFFFLNMSILTFYNFYSFIKILFPFLSRLYTRKILFLMLYMDENLDVEFTQIVTWRYPILVSFVRVKQKGNSNIFHKLLDLRFSNIQIRSSNSMEECIIYKFDQHYYQSIIITPTNPPLLFHGQNTKLQIWLGHPNFLKFRTLPSCILV